MTEPFDREAWEANLAKLCKQGLPDFDDPAVPSLLTPDLIDDLNDIAIQIRETFKLGVPPEVVGDVVGKELRDRAWWDGMTDHDRERLWAWISERELSAYNDFLSDPEP